MIQYTELLSNISPCADPEFFWGGDIKRGVVGGLFLGILQCEINKFDFPGEG